MPRRCCAEAAAGLSSWPGARSPWRTRPLVGSLERYTWPSTVAVLLPGTVALVVAWRGPLYDRVGPGPVSRLSVVGWASVLVLAGLWELTALLLQPNLQLGSIDHPTVSFMMDTVLAGHLGRTVTLLVWLALGWWLLSLAPARGRERAHEHDRGRRTAAP